MIGPARKLARTAPQGERAGFRSMQFKGTDEDATELVNHLDDVSMRKGLTLSEYAIYLHNLSTAIMTRGEQVMDEAGDDD